MSTPCVGVCVLDEAAGLCIGCGRTGQEIATWIAMGEEARLSVMAGLDARLAAARRTGAAPTDAERPD